MFRKLAVILAGGKGTRLKPYTLALPKPLVPLGDKPVLEIILTQLAEEGFSDIYIAVNHLAELIEAYCRDGSRYGLNIRYFLEDKPLGTMGPLRAMDNLTEDFIVMNGDILSDLRYGKFLEDHAGNAETLTVACHERIQKVDYGVLEIQDGVLRGFQEKPQLKYNVSMGVYALNRRVTELIPEHAFFGFDDLMHRMLDDGRKICTYMHAGYWMDIGRPQDYEKASADIESGSFHYGKGGGSHGKVQDSFVQPELW